MRPDVLELLAEELNERGAHPLASFLKWDEGAGQGRRRLDGMSAGRLRDFDREERAWEKASRKELKELAARLRWKRWYASSPANRERMLACRKQWAALHPDRERATSRRVREKRKKDPKRLALYKARQDKYRDKKNAKQRQRCIDDPAWYQRKLARHRLVAREAYGRTYKPVGKRRCSICRQPGHNNRRCGARP